MQAILFTLVVISTANYAKTGEIDYAVVNAVSGYTVDDCMKIAHDVNGITKLKEGESFMMCAPQIFNKEGDQLNPDGTATKHL